MNSGLGQSAGRNIDQGPEASTCAAQPGRDDQRCVTAKEVVGRGSGVIYRDQVQESSRRRAYLSLSLGRARFHVGGRQERLAVPRLPDGSVPRRRRRGAGAGADPDRANALSYYLSSPERSGACSRGAPPAVTPGAALPRMLRTEGLPEGPTAPPTPPSREGAVSARFSSRRSRRPRWRRARASFDHGTDRWSKARR